MRLRFLAILCAAVGAVLAPAADVPAVSRQTITFQQGVNGYTGTIDTEIWAVAPNTSLEANINASSDADNDGGESQVLMRFDGIMGTQSGLLPANATVHSASLIVSAFDEGTTVHLHRMLVPWKKTATWATLVGGVTADGLEASKKKDSFTFGKISASTSAITFEVTDTVQTWANGEENHGWVFINTGGNGWDFYTSEFEEVKQHPKLVIEFSVSRK